MSVARAAAATLRGLRRWLALAWRLLRVVVLELDPRPVELFAAQLSIWFALWLAFADLPNRPLPILFWPLWAAMAGTLKLVGIAPALLTTRPARWSRLARGLGNLAGLGLWGFVATYAYLVTNGGSLLWGGYAILALAQGWALFRILRRS